MAVFVIENAAAYPPCLSFLGSSSFCALLIPPGGVSRRGSRPGVPHSLLFVSLPSTFQSPRAFLMIANEAVPLVLREHIKPSSSSFSSSSLSCQ